jgi:hypothetical protein
MSADASCGGTVHVRVPLAFDNCGVGATSGVRSDGLALADTYPVGTTTITWTVTDIHGNAAIPVVQTIVVTDNELPVIITNGNKSVNNDESTCGAAVAVSASAEDNCGVGAPSGVRSDGLPLTDPYPVGTTTITWNVTDIHGNAAVPVVQTIVVADNELPVITTNGNKSVNNDAGTCGAAVTVSASAADNCGVGAPSGVRSDGLGLTDVYPVGTITITWTVTDIHGNAAVPAVQTIIVTDNELPVITTNGNKSVNNDAGKCGAAVTVNASAADNCGVGAPSGIRSDGLSLTDPYPVGTTTITWSVTDIHGNSSTATQTIVVTDNEKPVITAPASIAVNNDAGQCNAVVSIGSATTGDNCGVATTVNDHPSNVYPVGTTVVTWTVTDIHGNSSTATQTIVVTDNEKPVITAPAAIAVNNDAGLCNATINIGSATTGDNCEVAATVNDHPSNEYPVGTTVVTWTVTDIHGNSSTATQTIVVTDNEKPVITAPAAITVNNDAGVCSAAVAIGSAVTGDNCGVASVGNNHPSATYPVGTTTVTWTVTDIHGNTQTATQTVTVNDNEAPKANCKPVTVTLLNGVASITVASVNNNSTDNCGIASMTISKSTFNCINLGTNNVVLTVTDIHGNVSTCTAVVTVVGEIPTCSIASIPTNTTYTGGISTNLYLGYGAQSTTLKVTSPASGAPYTYAWSGQVGLLSSSTSASPVFTPTAGGVYTFTVVTTNKYGCTTSCSITICVTDIRVPGSDGKKVFVCHAPPGNPANWNTLSISVNAVPSHLGNHTGDRLGSCEQTPCSGTVTNAITQTVSQSATKETVVTTSEEDFTVKVAPNPSTSYFTLKFESKYKTPLNLRVMDESGRTIDARSKVGSNSTIQIGHNYSSGTYFAEILQGTKRKVVQLIKAR